MQILARSFLVLLLSVALASCSKIQLAYSTAPRLLQYQLDTYLDLNDEQERQLHQELIKLQNWHRTYALPHYARTLERWAVRLNSPSPFSTNEILLEMEQIRNALREFAMQAAATLAPTLMTLTPAQQQYLSKKFSQSNRDYAKTYLANSQEAFENRKARITENYERWLGSLSAEQESVLDQWLHVHPMNAQIWAEQRQARQQQLLLLISKAPELRSRTTAAAALYEYFETLIQPHPASNQPALAGLTAAMLNRMTPQQRTYLKDKLLGYARELGDLSIIERSASN